MMGPRARLLGVHADMVELCYLRHGTVQPCLPVQHKLILPRMDIGLQQHIGNLPGGVLPRTCGRIALERLVRDCRWI
jgi:hypothetical protein